MKRITLEEIPVISIDNQEDFLSKALDIKADGKEAKIFISDKGEWSDEKIVIVWKEKNKKYGESFTTKYFTMDEPGVLKYGHEGDQIILEI
ncbi:hypothetical protein ACFPIK_08945 [Algoriphagus aquatilis]|uniref:Uncharacterized protein n=1 Tax=Algoriphagus aquatilis TaxID=490186 RepID=A0ABW0BWC3_9BACT